MEPIPPPWAIVTAVNFVNYYKLLSIKRNQMPSFLRRALSSVRIGLLTSLPREEILDGHPKGPGNARGLVIEDVSLPALNAGNCGAIDRDPLRRKPTGQVMLTNRNPLGEP